MDKYISFNLTFGINMMHKKRRLKDISFDIAMGEKVQSCGPLFVVEMTLA